MHDALTGLPNRRALLECLPAAQARIGRDGHAMALLINDADKWIYCVKQAGRGQVLPRSIVMTARYGLDAAHDLTWPLA